MQDVKEDIGMITGSYEADPEGKRRAWRGSSNDDSGEVDVTRAARKKARTISNPNMLDPAAGQNQNMAAIQNKLRPLYVKYIEQAMADVKGVIGMQLKADAHDRALQKINILRSLKAMSDRIKNNPDDIPSDIMDRLKPALLMTAAYFYPDETGDITRNQYGSITPESHEGARRVVKDMLGVADVEMAEAPEAETGLQMVSDNDYDLILMDLRMPGMDGLEAIRLIRARHDSKANLPIIVVTADMSNNLREECLGIGADDFIQKPVAMDDMFASIGTVLAKHGSSAATL